MAHGYDRDFYVVSSPLLDVEDMRVKDLLQRDEVAWDKSLLEGILVPSDVTRVIANLISLHCRMTSLYGILLSKEGIQSSLDTGAEFGGLTGSVL